jgi:hypothetical protein
MPQKARGCPSILPPNVHTMDSQGCLNSKRAVPQDVINFFSSKGQAQYKNLRKSANPTNHYNHVVREGGICKVAVSVTL